MIERFSGVAIEVHGDKNTQFYMKSISYFFEQQAFCYKNDRMLSMWARAIEKIGFCCWALLNFQLQATKRTSVNGALEIQNRLVYIPVPGQWFKILEPACEHNILTISFS